MTLIFGFGNPVYDEIVTPAVATHGRVLSGCSTNACLILAALGYQAVLVGRVGPDFRVSFDADMARFGVSAAVSPDIQTGGFRLIYDRRGDRSLDILGIAGVIEQIPAQVSDAAALIVGPILQETPLAFIQSLRALSSAPIFLDPQGLLRRVDLQGRVEHFLPPDMPAIARCCDVIKANEIEARILTGIDPRDDIVAASQAMRALGCDIAIITLAESGSFINNGREQIPVPAYRTDARDPTGAGDTYLAGFVHAYLANPQDLYYAGCMGAAVASMWIEQTGPAIPMPFAEITRRLQVLLSLPRHFPMVS